MKMYSVTFTLFESYGNKTKEGLQSVCLHVRGANKFAAMASAWSIIAPLCPGIDEPSKVSATAVGQD